MPARKRPGRLAVIGSLGGAVVAMTAALAIKRGSLEGLRAAERRFAERSRAWGALRPRVKRFVLPARLLVTPPTTQIDRARWAREAQSGELDFHRHDEWRRTGDFAEDSARLFGHFGFGRRDYSGRVVIDLGAGSRLRTRYFEGAHLIAVEPLAEQFREIDFSDLASADELYAKPAEELLVECLGRADLLVSINVLDHCYDFDAVLANIRQYLAADGKALLSFDCHTKVDDLHPLVLTPKVCRKALALHGLEVTHESKGLGREVGYRYYGHPPYALNYIVRPASATAAARG